MFQLDAFRFIYPGVTAATDSLTQTLPYPASRGITWIASTREHNELFRFHYT